MTKNVDSYYDKYLKYKSKYLLLKKQFGGKAFDNLPPNIITNLFPYLNDKTASELSQVNRKFVCEYGKEFLFQKFSVIQKYPTDDKNKIKKIYFDIDVRITQGMLPQSLKELTFGKEFTNGGRGQPLEVGVLPQSLIKVISSYIPGLLKVGVLPDSLQELTFGDGIAPYFTVINVLPKKLQTLTFGRAFNVFLERDILPKSLKTLTFGKNFDNGGMSLTVGVLPKLLQTLTFGDWFNNGGQQLVVGILPQTLKELTFGAYFTNGHEQLKIGVLPKSLETLTFGDKFNNGSYPLAVGVLPQLLQELTFGAYFTNGDQPLTVDILPKSLKKLTINTKFTNGGQDFPPNIVVYRK